MTTAEGTLAAEAAPQVIGKIETDIFCPGCHYNLHSLDVVRDGRLDIAVVRCPECGKYHPAGIATGAGRVWLSRLAMFLILTWVIFLGLFVLAIGLGFFITDIAGVEGFMTGTQINGRYLRVEYVPTNENAKREVFLMNLLLHGSALLLGWILGAGAAVFVWHRNRAWLISLCVLSMIAAGIAGLAFSSETRYWAPAAINWATGRIVTLILLQCGGILIGILLGRAVTRGILSVLLTRRLLQHLRFLWTVDKKVAPGTE